MSITSTVAEIYDQLFGSVNGYTLSSIGKTSHSEYDNSDFTYGEVTAQSMESILSVLPETSGVFCDLGSGTGKAVVLAPLIGKFVRSIGVELVPELHDAAVAIGKRFDAEVRPTLSGSTKDTVLEFRNHDIFTTDISACDVLFAHCTTCFSPEMMEKFIRKCEEAHSGATIACVSRRLETDCFEQRSVSNCNMGWGTATVFVYTRK